MFKVTTASGKEFDSDYATSIGSPPMAFIRIVGEDMQTVEDVFSDSQELPIQGYESFTSFVQAIQERDAVKVVLKN